MGDNGIYFYTATQCVSSIFYREAIHNMYVYINLYICKLCIYIHMLWRVNRDAQHTYMYTHTNVCLHIYIYVCVCVFYHLPIKYRRNALCQDAKIYSLISLLQYIPFPFLKIGALK